MHEDLTGWCPKKNIVLSGGLCPMFYASAALRLKFWYHHHNKIIHTGYKTLNLFLRCMKS